MHREQIIALTNLMMTNDDFLLYVDYVLSCYEYYAIRNVEIPQRMLVDTVKEYLRGDRDKLPTSVSHQSGHNDNTRI